MSEEEEGQTFKAFSVEVQKVITLANQDPKFALEIKKDPVSTLKKFRLSSREIDQITKAIR